MPNETSILSLPKEILSSISSWLDDRESCGVEVTSRSLYFVLSDPCGPPRTRLNLGPSWAEDEPPTDAPFRQELSGASLDANAFMEVQCTKDVAQCLNSSSLRYWKLRADLHQIPRRWLQKRVMRYSHISCEFCDATMLERSEAVGNGNVIRIVPPLLPSLLSACAPSAELQLLVNPGQGTA